MTQGKETHRETLLKSIQ